MKFHCLFEQSGTFKNVLKSYGHQSFDYDILNDYGQTDFQIDLFEQINRKFKQLTCAEKCKTTFKCYLPECYGKTIFDAMKPETDFIIAFFPCTYFSDMNEMIFKSPTTKGMTKNNNLEDKNFNLILKRNRDRCNYFELFLKLCFVCQKLRIPTIIENPSSPIYRNYLELYSPYRPSWREKDRTLFGDKFRKPTNYFAINFEMNENFMMFDEEINKKSIKGRTRLGNGIQEKSQIKRSEITPRYADNFYKRFLAGIK